MRASRDYCPYVYDVRDDLYSLIDVILTMGSVGALRALQSSHGRPSYKGWLWAAPLDIPLSSLRAIIVIPTYLCPCTVIRPMHFTPQV